MDNNRTTMADVARKAGVSLMTVSRVINNKDDVSQATREHVLDVIDRLDFRPSGIARGLATQRTGTLGLVVPDVANPFFADVALGVEQKTSDAGYVLFLCNTGEESQREKDVLKSLEEKRIDGLILCSSRLEEKDLKSLLKQHPAVVLVNRQSEIDGVFSVMVDDVAGGEMVTRHLLQSGHRAIGFLVGPDISFSGRQRNIGRQTALKSFGLEQNPAWVKSCAPVVESGERAARELLSQHPELTAVVCHNDMVAIGVLRACQAMGLDVPGDVAVAGYDDVWISSLVTPPLTTCRVPRFELGEQAVSLLLNLIENDNSQDTPIVLQPELVVRASAP
ncbi:MAG: LacI family DNA-binding transcriptional regulator [Anaerolineales bacterium]|nr:LacI family DNA-binding transcriptional regulator [Anaerolineales bacterium]